MTFGHHPDPAVDFCVEVDVIEGLVYDAKHGLIEYKPIEDRVCRAMQFRVGGVSAAVEAKQRLRIAEEYLTGRKSKLRESSGGRDAQ